MAAREAARVKFLAQHPQPVQPLHGHPERGADGCEEGVVAKGTVVQSEWVCHRPFELVAEGDRQDCSSVRPRIAIAGAAGGCGAGRLYRAGGQAALTERIERSRCCSVDGEREEAFERAGRIERDDLYRGWSADPLAAHLRCQIWLRGAGISVSARAACLCIAGNGAGCQARLPNASGSLSSGCNSACLPRILRIGRFDCDTHHAV
eukprot:scaffold15511_cov135-Isochrysis_galbana.AAC.4